MFQFGWLFLSTRRVCVRRSGARIWPSTNHLSVSHNVQLGCSSPPVGCMILYRPTYKSVVLQFIWANCLHMSYSGVFIWLSFIPYRNVISHLATLSHSLYTSCRDVGPDSAGPRIGKTHTSHASASAAPDLMFSDVAFVVLGHTPGSC